MYRSTAHAARETVLNSAVTVPLLALTQAQQAEHARFYGTHFERMLFAGMGLRAFLQTVYHPSVFETGAGC